MSFNLAELFFYVAERTERSFNKGQTTTAILQSVGYFLYYLWGGFQEHTHCLSAITSTWGVTFYNN